MLLTNQASIRDVLLFPHMKPEKGFQSGAAAAKAAEAGNASSPFVKSLKPTLDYSKIAVEPLFEEFVDFDTFSKSDFRAVKVKACEAVKKSKKLLNFTLDDGTGTTAPSFPASMNTMSPRTWSARPCSPSPTFLRAR